MAWVRNPSKTEFFQAPLVQLSQLHLTFKDPSISFIEFYSQFKIWFISLRFWNSTAKLLSRRQFLVQVDIICHRMGAHLNVCDLLRLRLLLKGITPISQFYCTVGYIVDERLCLGVLLKYATCGLLGFSPYFIWFKRQTATGIEALPALQKSDCLRLR